MIINVWNLTENEKKACTLLSTLCFKNEEDGFPVYYKCAENDMILEKASKLLDGRSSVRFIVDIMISLYGMFNLRTLGDYRKEIEVL